VDKLFRNYRLFIQRNDKADPGDPLNYITVEPPFTLEFDVQKNTLSSMNIATLKVYNLGHDTRDHISWNVYDTGSYRRVILEAGYGKNLTTIFRGNINKCESVRQGSSFITTIEGDSGGYANVNATFNLEFIKGTARNDIIDIMLDSTKEVHLIPGTVSASFDPASQLSRGNSYSGPTVALIAELLGGGVFIDNETINCLQDDEFIYSAVIPEITSDTGLLGTPIRQREFLTFEVLFEPNIRMGYLVNLQSSSGNNYDGIYKVVGIQHRGTISGAVCGDAVTSVQVPYIKNYKPISGVFSVA
jgi:hypothetical protein